MAATTQIICKLTDTAAGTVVFESDVTEQVNGIIVPAGKVEANKTYKLELFQNTPDNASDFKLQIAGTFSTTAWKVEYPTTIPWASITGAPKLDNILTKAELKNLATKEDLKSKVGILELDEVKEDIKKLKAGGAGGGTGGAATIDPEEIKNIVKEIAYIKEETDNAIKNYAYNKQQVDDKIAAITPGLSDAQVEAKIKALAYEKGEVDTKITTLDGKITPIKTLAEANKEAIDGLPTTITTKVGELAYNKTEVDQLIANNKGLTAEQVETKVKDITYDKNQIDAKLTAAGGVTLDQVETKVREVAYNKGEVDTKVGEVKTTLETFATNANKFFQGIIPAIDNQIAVKTYNKGEIDLKLRDLDRKIPTGGGAASGVTEDRVKELAKEHSYSKQESDDKYVPKAGFDYQNILTLANLREILRDHFRMHIPLSPEEIAKIKWKGHEVIKLDLLCTKPQGQNNMAFKGVLIELTNLGPIFLHSAAPVSAGNKTRYNVTMSTANYIVGTDIDTTTFRGGEANGTSIFKGILNTQGATSLTDELPVYPLAFTSSQEMANRLYFSTQLNSTRWMLDLECRDTIRSIKIISGVKDVFAQKNIWSQNMALTVSYGSNKVLNNVSKTSSYGAEYHTWDIPQR
jgi:hypothetical protein